ncbi:hypothetical protein [Solwaraspora sp. WMMD792]|uniref:hypothetical protein n=1 Tax=Solwaraspora sp. WMMD792 TaxID=3016099 RepID=UPI00241614B2|nr:hypothetical protein [Solwaraspora sp. WMMD792]MDG4768737.1 hypothetical protein [Solwaraspora sp. WMMD792]MDG4768776.1 hypothetical protein [Solwaraspora sp. WMMD792]MDG4768818.1 hypothetical protein [Solwaraspora sp. WMMD792]MDG4768869.1 hypothetical protein [Solwaraspora sp. WMMD792]MDG4768899.1 hypothetical protein [Solwaraspora sp. WMMD792]
MTAMDDGPITDQDIDDAAAGAVHAHAAGHRCHTDCPGTEDCPQLVWARTRRAIAKYRLVRRSI